MKAPSHSFSYDSCKVRSLKTEARAEAFRLPFFLTRKSASAETYFVQYLDENTIIFIYIRTGTESRFATRV